MSLEKSIKTAASDIADALTKGRSPRRQANLKRYLEAAIWSATASADRIPGNAWIDPRSINEWVRNAAEAEPKIKLSDDIPADKFRDIAVALGLDAHALEKILDAQLMTDKDGSLQKEVDSILGNEPASGLASAVGLSEKTETSGPALRSEKEERIPEPTGLPSLSESESKPAPKSLPEPEPLPKLTPEMKGRVGPVPADAPFEGESGSGYKVVKK